jgi:hypothetical protein
LTALKVRALGYFLHIIIDNELDNILLSQDTVKGAPAQFAITLLLGYIGKRRLQKKLASR